MILVIDNYDSFTFNLVQYLGELGAEIKIYRNDRIDSKEAQKLNPQGIIISPGPGRPENAGISVPLIQELNSDIPFLGVCLGHQAIGIAFGGKVVSAPKLMHGKTSEIYHQSQTILKNLSNPFTATRYHSLIVDKATLPEELVITAETDDGIIMAMQHKTRPIFGVQFHPESILTHEGKKMLGNFLEECHKNFL